MRWAAYCFAFLLSGCGVAEQNGFLVGRRCLETEVEPCDQGQACLPHAIRQGAFDEFRCRDEASLQPFEHPTEGPTEPPLAYCDDTITCPGRTVCAVDRVREGDDAGFRRRVCRPADVAQPSAMDGGV